MTRRIGVALVAIGVLVGAACSDERAMRRHYENGARYLDSGQFAEAIIELRSAVDRDGRWGEARFKLAEAYAASGNPEAAFREYVRAADLLPDRADVQLKAVTYLIAAEHYEDAQTRIQPLIDRDPSNVEARIALGNALAGLRDLDGAVARLNEAIALEPQRSGSYANLGQIRVAQGRIDEARAAFETAVQTDPNSVAAWLALANFQWSSGDVERAESSLRRALDVNPRHVLAHRALATFYLFTGQSAQAEPHLQFVARSTELPAAKLDLADFYIREARPDDARRLLEPLAANARVATAVEARLAGLVYIAGQTTLAHQRLDALLKTEPNNADALLLKARWLLSEGHREQALNRAIAAVSVNPQLVEGHYIRGVAEAAAHRSSDAIKSFSEVLKLNARATAARIQLSRLHLARNAVDSAVLFAEEALSSSPNSVDAQLCLIRAWAARGDLERAGAAIAQVRRLAPELASVHALEGAVHLVRGNQQAASEAFERAIRIDAGNIEALEGLTTIDVVSGHAARARVRADAVIAAGAQGPAVLLIAAKAALAARDLSHAEALLRRIIELDPLDIEPFALLGQVLGEQNKLAAARNEFEAVIEREPRNLAARLMVALIVHSQNDTPAAVTHYTEVLKLQPRAALAANNLASIYSQAGENLDLAQQLAEGAADQFPTNAAVQDTLGWIYYQRHALGQAILRFEQSIAADRTNARYHYHLGLAYTKNGELDRARQALQTALRLNPELGPAKEVLASLKTEAR